MLDILPAGQYPTEYLSLLKSQRMSELIAQCREEYDLVIVDTPPVLIFADALTISRNTDGIVLVGRVGVTNPQAAKDAKELLQQFNQKVFGLVVNGVDSKLDSYHQYAKNYNPGSQIIQPNLLPPSDR